MRNKDFVHLHLHTDYSLLDGAIQVKPLAQRVAELNMSACAITDHGNLFGAIAFYQAMKGQGVKPIIGCEVYFTRGSRLDRSAGAAGEKINHHLILLAENLEGYHNLVRLTSKAYTEGFYYKPRIDRDLLAQHSRGLIGLSACLSGVPAWLLTRGAFDEAAVAVHDFVEILGKGNYFLEIQDHALEAQQQIRKPLVELAKRTGVPLVATNDAHYLWPEDARAHDVLLCIGTGKTIHDEKRLRYGSPFFYVRTPEEMWRLFGDELPQALERTTEIAERCQLVFPKGTSHLPVYPVPEANQSVDEYFEKVVRSGYEQRRQEIWEPREASGELKHTLAEYQERISREVAMIKQMGFASYFLIVWDFIKYAREHQIPVGPGRGSAAGSLVAYCLNITDVDPLHYDLLFERFLNPDRVSMPDIDIDFCVRGRDEVIKHVMNLYGRNSVCQIITFGTMASRAAIKDVGRALDMPYVEVERIAKMVPPPVRGRNVTITQALEQAPELRAAVEQNAAVAELIDLAKRLEGCARHASVHAAGVVISPVPLDELVPIAISARTNEITTQYAMNDLEKTGMLKMDFLALTALTVVSDCLKSIKRSLNTDVKWSSTPLDDALTMRLFSEGRTEAVFQFESPGMQEICRRLKPKGLEDLAALNALYRPGPLDGGMVDDFIERHHGHKAVRYLVPEMKEILNNTYGIIVYQEQIMQLAQKLAGYTLGEADLMRRAMGKKKRDEMAVHEKKFIQGAVARKLREERAQQIFSLMAQFADYGFNRSHSVAYAYLAFQTAYLKAHYPEHFYAAVLSNELQDTAKVLKYTKELRGQQVQLLPPDINESGAGFTAGSGTIRYGLAAIKGIGQASVEALIRARSASGRFTSVFDLAERVDSHVVNKRVLESLIAAGALDSLSTDDQPVHLWRARLYSGVDIVLSGVARSHRAISFGQNNLFGGVVETPESHATAITKLAVEAWSHTALLEAEKRAIGFYISGHPLQEYSNVLGELKCLNTLNIQGLEKSVSISLGGIITVLQKRTTKRGDSFAVMHIEDQTGSVKCLIWPEIYAKCQHLLQDGVAVHIYGKLDVTDEGGATIVVDEVERLDEILQRRSHTVIIHLPTTHALEHTLTSLFRILDGQRGECEVILELPVEDNIIVRARAHGALRVRGGLELESALRTIGCTVKWKGHKSLANNSRLRAFWGA